MASNEDVMAAAAAVADYLYINVIFTSAGK